MRLSPLGSTVVAAAVASLSVAWAGPPLETLRVVQDRMYRLGVFLVVDAVVENAALDRVDAAEVSVEFYDFFDELLSVEHTLVRPTTLARGQRATLRVATPWNDNVRKVRYRFTWRIGPEQFQTSQEHYARIVPAP